MKICFQIRNKPRSSYIQLPFSISGIQFGERVLLVVKVFVVALGLVLSCVNAQSKNLPVFGAQNQIHTQIQAQIQVAQNVNQYPVPPSEAANIAMGANPGSKVLNVKLLPSGVYAVTLKNGGSVSRVMVDATSGAIS
jgi:uncharacterized membrane protein YkoI